MALKETVKIKSDIGQFNIDSIDEMNATIAEQVLQMAGAFKARGATSAKITLQFDYKATSE